MLVAQGLCFVAGQASVVGSTPNCVIVADLNGDDDVDLVVSNLESKSVSVLLNSGHGVFKPAVDYDVPRRPHSVCAGDLDSDGDADLAVAHENGITILRNLGNGAFLRDSRGYGAVYTPESVVASDIDNDGDVDLAVSNVGSHKLSILANQGDGSFRFEGEYLINWGPSFVAAADLDGDTDNDLAICRNMWNTISILLNNGDGTFQTALLHTTGESPKSLVAVDLDADSDLDLAVANSSSNTLSVLFNNGFAVFAPAVNYPVVGNPQSMCSSDVDGDDDADLVIVGSHRALVLRNYGDGTFPESTSYELGGGPSWVVAADVEGDADRDIVATAALTNNVVVLTNCEVPPCGCACHGDPVCDGVIADISDVVTTIDVAFGSESAPADPGHTCAWERTDVNCSGTTDIVDVVRTISTAIRGTNPATVYCQCL